MIDNDVTNLELVEGIGPKTKELLAKLQIYTIDDLINHYPFRYEVLRRTNLSEIKDGDKVTIDGVIEGQPTIIYINPKLKKIIFRINTGNNILNITVYNQAYLMQDLKTTRIVTIIGKYDKLRNTIVANEVKLGGLPPIPKIESIYYTTSGLPRKNIARFINNSILNHYTPKELIPEYLINKYNLMEKYDAISQIHEPLDVISLKKARQRLKYEELFLYLLRINYLKDKINSEDKKLIKNINKEEINKFIKKIPFTLTIDQEIAVEEIINDMSSNKRMNRLLQGDVGSGKTIVALIAAYANFLSKYQTAIMVPTEILANQHYDESLKLFKNTKMNIELLTSSTTKKDKSKIKKDLSEGKIDLIIGTQSLIQENIQFKNLGLVITDEQHRFGVNQRTSFKNKGITPDVLSMSATPIPRTYALTIYGDMEVSSIKTKPNGRKDVVTYFKKEKDITDVLTMMKEELDKKHQIYVIAPMIEKEEDGNDNNIESVKELEEKMNKAFGKIAKIASIHGKVEPKEKNKIMKEYENNNINILISTTVIEVGVNVPNASMIVIFDANLFGLSTIHQLRGRVGRSDIQSYCILIAKEYHEKLKFLENCKDGFKISEYDFTNRGEGDLFGIRQSGETGLILANVNKDYQMLLKARDDVLEFIPIYKENPDKYPDIKDLLNKLTLED